MCAAQTFVKLNYFLDPMQALPPVVVVEEVQLKYMLKQDVLPSWPPTNIDNLVNVKVGGYSNLREF